MIHIVTLFALADVVGPGPADCPAGSSPTSNHAGPYCRPQTCENTCESGQRCASAGLCVLEEVRPCAGEGGKDCTYVHREARGTCTTQDDCSGGTTCELVDRCVRSGWGCSTAAPWAPLVFGLGMLPLLFRRSRRS